MNTDLKQKAESKIQDRVAEFEHALLESVESTSSDALHVVLEHDPEGEELTEDEAISAANELIGAYEGIIRSVPMLYDRAVFDFLLAGGSDGRLRYEMPTPWAHAYHADKISLEELVDRVWDTIHYVDSDGVPHSTADLEEMLPDDVSFDSDDERDRDDSSE